VKPEFAFDVSLDVYRACWEECYEAGHLRAVDATAFKEHRWRPDRKPRAEDFVADFCLAGHAALMRAGLHSRIVLFDIHFAGTCPYENARRWFGLSELGWVRWTDDIRRVVGEELMRRGIFPAKKYFEEFCRR
jgi:hypothetical protein